MHILCLWIMIGGGVGEFAIHINQRFPFFEKKGFAQIFAALRESKLANGKWTRG